MEVALLENLLFYYLCSQLLFSDMIHIENFVRPPFLKAGDSVGVVAIASQVQETPEQAGIILDRIYLGYEIGVHAPGKKVHGYPTAAHILLLAHGLAVKAYRETGLKSPIGITLNPAVTRPATSSEQDGIAAWMEMVTQTDLFLDPLTTGTYPKVL